MFIDIVKVELKAGSGGDGCISFRREKFEPSGGPYGGDGGNGGSIIIISDSNLTSLLDYKFKKHYKAENGQNGMTKRQYGRNGKDLILKVPVGTLIKDYETDKVIHDFKKSNEEFVICKGGRGGRGNAKFATSTRQAPRFAEPGKKGEIKTINLELKMIADVGLIGKPNVGKSSILSKISNANPKIGNYNFTTLSPNLGIVKIDSEHSYVVADIPGLIEGAAKGTGLGYSFLKHIERTKILVHVLDGSGLTGDPIENYYSIWKELEEYNVNLKDKNEIIVINKIDILSSKEYIKKIKEEFKNKKIIEISALKNDGIKEFIYQIWNEIKDLRDIYETYDDEYEEVVEKKSKGYNISLKDDVFFLDGDFIEDLCYRTNFDDEFSIKHFQSVLEKKGIINELKKMGIKEGQTVIVDKNEFEFIE